MTFPYGIADFGKIRHQGYFYQDRTHLIPHLEAAGEQLLFLRPRRFGKSLLVSMLEHYYDVNQADQFAALFGDLAIGQNPTPLHNRYFILHWDFSVVKTQGEAREQALRYGHELKTRYRLNTITGFAVVALGLERIVFQKVSSPALPA